LQIQHREMPSEMFFFLDSVSNKSNSSVFWYIEGFFKNNVTMILQMLLCGRCYENVNMFTLKGLQTIHH
jgi:hypothetical protein